MIRALALLFACLALASCSQRKEPPLAGKPALWVIEDNAGQAAGWLFGTIHALPDRAEWVTPVLNRAIRRAGVLLVEVSDLDPNSISAQFDRLAHDRPGPPLERRLPPGPRRELTAWLADEGTSSQQYDGLETWAAALALARLGATAQPNNGVDRALLSRFSGRPVIELEGAAGQLAIFDRLSERDQRAMLAAVIAEHGDGEAQAQMLARAWIVGDLARMEQAVRTGLLADPALYRELLAKRNAAWLHKIVRLLADGKRPLVGVGAAHMLGSDGLPNLLRAKGYRIHRVQ